MFYCSIFLWAAKLYLFISTMHIKQRIKKQPISSNTTYYQYSPRNYTTHSSPIKTASIFSSVKSTSPSIEKYPNSTKLNTERKKIPEAQYKCHQFSTLSSKHNSSYFEALKNRIKDVLRRMKYKDKLNHLESLLKQAQKLSQKFGYFYVTGANFVYMPESEIKLALWIHPNLNQNRRIHPIQKRTVGEKKKEFYKSLKMSLKQLFPTISLGDGSSFQELMDNISEQQQNLTKRLIKSVSTNIISVLNSPQSNSSLSKTHSNKILKISRLVDFNEGISVIEEGDQDISLTECEDKIKSSKKSSAYFHQEKKFKKKNPSQQTQCLHISPSQMIHTLDEKKIPTSRSIINNDQSFQINVSNFMKEDEGEFTLEDSKVRPGTSRISSKLISDLRQILNA